MIHTLKSQGLSVSEIAVESTTGAAKLGQWGKQLLAVFTKCQCLTPCHITRFQ